MEEAPEKGKEPSHSAHVNGMNERKIMSFFPKSVTNIDSIHIPQELLIRLL